MKNVTIDDGYDWPMEEGEGHVKKDFTVEDAKKGFCSTPMDREKPWGGNVRTSVRQRAHGKEETYSRRKN